VAELTGAAAGVDAGESAGADAIFFSIRIVNRSQPRLTLETRGRIRAAFAF